MAAIEWIRGATEPPIPFTYEGVDVTGWTITLHVNATPSVVSKVASIVDGPNGKAQVDYAATDWDAATVGTYDGEWVLDDAAGNILKVQGFQFILKEKIG